MLISSFSPIEGGGKLIDYQLITNKLINYGKQAIYFDRFFHGKWRFFQ